MTAIAHATQTPPPPVVRMQRQTSDLAERVAVLALGIFASVAIIATIPPPTPIFLAMVITIITLLEAFPVEGPLCYSDPVEVVEREVPVIVNPPVRYVRRGFYNPPPFYVEASVIPIVVPPLRHRHVEVVPPPDANIRYPVGRREGPVYSEPSVGHREQRVYSTPPDPSIRYPVGRGG